MVLAMPRFFPAWPNWPSWIHRPAELRIDVHRPHKPGNGEFESVYDRLHSPGNRLYALPTVGLDDPDLVIRYREADGEFYVYVEDIRRRRLAGYTVFNRLVEVSRRADRHVRSPHSRYDTPYQRRGLATAVYNWGLEAGLCLMTGARQSPGAHALWHALGRRYEWGYVTVRNKTLTCLGKAVTADMRDDLHTRMVLLGDGWTMERFASATGMLHAFGADPAQ